MNCVKCDGRTLITDSRKSPLGIRRRHLCKSCKHRFTTIEISMGEYTSIMSELNKYKTACESMLRVVEEYRRDIE